MNHFFQTPAIIGSQLCCVLFSLRFRPTSPCLSSVGKKCHLMMEIPHIIRAVPSVWGSRDGASSVMRLGAFVSGNPPKFVVEMPDGFELRGQAESIGLIHLQNHLFKNFANSTLRIPSWLPKMPQCACTVMKFGGT